MKQEHKASKSSHFITLTYGPGQLPKDGKVNKRDVQLFMKKLRKYFPESLRFYCVGEYGTKFGRPHYHMLLFNAENITDTILKKTWEHGYCHVGKITEASIMYTTKYMIQRNSGFVLMSRSFGIGAHYLTDSMVAWHRAADRNYAIDKGVKTALPRFYKEKIWRKEELLKLGHKWLWQGIKSEREDLRRLVRQGYTNKDIDEMRNAFLSKVKEKVAYTQTF